VGFLMPSSNTDTMYFNVIHTHQSLFLSLLPPALKQPHDYKYTLTLDSACEKNIQPLTFWTWFILLNKLISNSIHFLQMTQFHSSLHLNNTPLCIYATFSLSTHQVKGIQADSIAWLL
jgi:hypothetical protein